MREALQNGKIGAVEGSRSQPLVDDCRDDSVDLKQDLPLPTNLGEVERSRSSDPSIRPRRSGDAPLNWYPLKPLTTLDAIVELEL